VLFGYRNINVVYRIENSRSIEGLKIATFKKGYLTPTDMFQTPTIATGSLLLLLHV